VIVSCRQEVVWTMALVPGSSQHRGGNELMSLKPNRSWMHVHMALNDRTTTPRRQSLCNVQFAVSLSPSITAVAAGRWRADSASQMLQHEIKGLNRLGPP